MPIEILNGKDAAIIIGHGDVGLTGMMTDGGHVGLVINQFKDKVEITDRHLSERELEDRYDKDAPMATLVFYNKIALQNTINILEGIKEYL